VDEEALRAFFPLPQVLEGLFLLAETLFNITIKQGGEGTVDTWHPDVTYYSIHNKGLADDANAWFLTHELVMNTNAHPCTCSPLHSKQGSGYFTGDQRKPIAAFFLDPYSRSGEKNGGAWMNVCLHRSGSGFCTHM